MQFIRKAQMWRAMSSDLDFEMKWESVAGHSRKRETVMQRINVVNIRYDFKKTRVYQKDK